MNYLVRTLLSLFLLGGCVATIANAQSEAAPLNVFYGDIPEAENTFFVAPDGDDAAAGTEEEPFATLQHAVAQVTRGDVIVMRGGIYHHDDTIRLQSPSGFTNQLITVTAYPGEVPILDFSTQPKERNYHGLRINANYWHVIGLTIRNASHNGIRMDGSFNILEQITSYGNHDSGIHMAGGASFNLIKNSDSFHNFNYDTNRTPRIGNNADGFSAKFSIGPGNRYEGCRAWENSDDGFDFWEAEGTILIENTWAFGNGDAEVFGNPANFEGNGNGFKLGGNFVRADHVVRRSMAFDNFGASGNAKGFDFNSNPGAMTLEHNSAFNNGRNYWFPLDPPDGQAVFINNLSAVTSRHANLPPSAVVAGNSWQFDIEVTEDMFVSVDTEPAKGPRERDGSLPEIDLLRLVPGTFLVDGGVAYGQPFYGAAPDIGARPLEEGSLVEPWVDIGTLAPVADLRVYDLEASSAWDLVDDLDQAEEAFSDAEYVISSFPDVIEVDAWIKTAFNSGDKNYLFTVAEFSVTDDATILIAHSDQIAGKPAWLSEFEETDESIVIVSGEVDYTMTVYRRDVEAGDSIVLGRNAQQPTTAPMYLALVGSMTTVSAEDHPPVADGFVLHQNYPNPFSSSTTITYEVATSGNVSIAVYDATGREVASLASGVHTSGTHSITWTPGSLASGIYHVRMISDAGTHVRRLVLVR